MNSRSVAFLLTALASLILAAAAPARAALINITNKDGALVGDVAMKDLGNNNPSTSFDWLAGQDAFAGKGIVAGYNTIAGASLPVPIFADFLDAGDSGKVDVTGYSYAVLHYGVGKNGAKGSGGGIVAYYLNDAVGLLTLPIKGLGPNGFGGLSSVRLYGAEPRVTVPDTGATLLLVGASLAGIAWFGRRRK